MIRSCKQTKYVLSLLLTLALGACAVPNTPSRTAATAVTRSEHAAQARVQTTAADWAGVYAGILPCADCPGVRELLVLKKGNIYALSTSYVDRPGSAFRREDSFVWLDKHTIRLQGMQNPIDFQIGKNQVIQLGMDGKPITGPLASHMILKKIPLAR